MTFFREVQVLSRNTTHAGGVECAHTLRGIDTEVFLPVDDQNRGIPFSNEFVRGIVKRALSNLVVLFPGGENRGGGGLPLQPRPKGHAPGQHQEQAGRPAAEKQHRGFQETL